MTNHGPNSRHWSPVSDCSELSFVVLGMNERVVIVLMSDSSVLILAAFPPDCFARANKGAACNFGMTIAPLASFNSSPSACVMGAPSDVPTASTLIVRLC